MELTRVRGRNVRGSSAEGGVREQGLIGKWHRRKVGGFLAFSEKN